MGGIRVFVLRRDFTLAKKKIRPNASHFHYGKGSYLNKGEAILKIENKRSPPVLIFQEGNAIPEGGMPKMEIDENPQSKQHPLESIKWETWYIPMLRGLNREHHGRTNFDLRRVFNLNTLPFWFIGLFLLWHFLGPILTSGAAPSPSPPPLP